MQMELKVLAFVKAHRENNFALYVETLVSLAPWSFALDHTNYARWLPIHIRDMKCLPRAVQESFRKCWVIYKSSNTFSSIPIDQAHEQNNASVKGSGGAVGLTESPVAFRRWMVARPETARVLQEFESQLKGETNVDEKNKHHEQGLSTQKTFQSHVKNLVSTISEMGTPLKMTAQNYLPLTRATAQMPLSWILCIESRKLVYADSKFLPFLENHLKSTKRIDVVWDEYRVASLKDSAREKRGKGVRRKVAGHVKLPQNWKAFLEDSSNKKELFDFLTKQVEAASFPALESCLHNFR